MRIGILTIHHADNYGSVLQCYATQYMLREMGHDAVILDYTCPQIRDEYGMARVFAQPGLVKKLEAAIRISFLRRARKRFALFRKRYYRLAALDQNAQEAFDVYLVGSDQVWNYKITGFDTTYFLDFVREDAKKISYASSFGLSVIEPEFRERYSALLKRFAYLSVREREGAELIRQLTGRTAAVVLDPVFMATRRHWEEILTPPRTEKDYILLYYIAYSRTLMDFALDLSKRTGRPIVSIQGSLRRSIHAAYIWDAGPSEYLGLIQNAAYVVTNSFHGTAFSILFRKRFFVEMLPSFERTNSRLKHILSLFHLREREIVCGQNSCGDKALDGASIEGALTRYREESRAYLQVSLEGRRSG